MGDIREVTYETTHNNDMDAGIPGIQTLSIAELKRRAGMENLRDVQRIQFFLLLLYTEGAGEHGVDFVTHSIRPNTLILVKPGQVQQFSLNPTLAGQLIVINPSFLLPEQRDDSGLPPRLWWPAHTELSDDLARRFLSIAADIHSDSERYVGHRSREALLQYQLHTLLLLLRLSRDGGLSSAASGKIYNIVIQFKQIVEEEYFNHRSIPFYAQRLECIEKTLTRACLSVEGRSAKAILDERILLEAKRVLAHGRDSVADVAQQLGFSETTNFIRFFKKHEQVTPARFRDRHTRPQ